MELYEKCQSNFNYHTGRNYQQNTMAQHYLMLNLFTLIKLRVKNVFQYQDLEKSIKICTKLTYCKVFFKKIKRLMPYDQPAIKTFHQSPSPFKIVCHNYPTPNTLITNQPSDNKKSLEFQLYLNFNYTWGFHRQNPFFQIARPVMDKKTKKIHQKW